MTTRRAALFNIAGVAAASAVPGFGQNPPPENHHSTQPVTKQEATAYRFVYFRPEQMDTLEALTETIIPADGHSPGAKAARVSEYIDAIVADAPSSTKTQWKDGLEAVDRIANLQFSNPYGKCTEAQQIKLLMQMARNEGREVTPEEHFFAVLKRATIDGYYTSRIGIHEDLHYHGNAALTSYPDCNRHEG